MLFRGENAVPHTSCVGARGGNIGRLKARTQPARGADKAAAPLRRHEAAAGARRGAQRADARLRGGVGHHHVVDRVHHVGPLGRGKGAVKGQVGADDVARGDCQQF